MPSSEVAADGGGGGSSGKGKSDIEHTERCCYQLTYR